MENNKIRIDEANELINQLDEVTQKAFYIAINMFLAIKEINGASTENYLLYYTVVSIMEDLGCAREKCIQTLAELYTISLCTQNALKVHFGTC